MNIRYLFLGSLLILLFACNNYNHKRLDKDPIVTSVFSHKEIESLDTVLLFFRDAVNNSNNIKTNDFSIKFNNYLAQIGNKSHLVSDIYRNLDFDSERKSSVISELKISGLFDELYYEDTIYYNTETNQYTREVTDSLVNIHIRPIRNGKYQQLIDEWSKTDSTMLEYSKTLLFAGDITPSFIARMVKDYQSFDLSSERVQLFYALTFIMLQEPLKIISRK
jgi:hypothetical protein